MAVKGYGFLLDHAEGACSRRYLAPQLNGAESSSGLVAWDLSTLGHSRLNLTALIW
jgi:hypothetical protein